MRSRKVKIKNITWNFKYVNSDDLEFGIGFGTSIINQNMMKRFIRECGVSSAYSRKKLPPHYFEEDQLSFDGSEHECYNADTMIVLMNWLHDKRRNYNLTHYGDDPYWLFHDHCHSKWDVYSNEVAPISAYTEYQRVLEGAEMAKDHNVLIAPSTAVDLLKAWEVRFGTNSYQISARDFWPFFDGRREEEFDYLLSIS